MPTPLSAPSLPMRKSWYCLRWAQEWIVRGWQGGLGGHSSTVQQCGEQAPQNVFLNRMASVLGWSLHFQPLAPVPPHLGGSQRVKGSFSLLSRAGISLRASSPLLASATAVRLETKSWSHSAQ